LKATTQNVRDDDELGRFLVSSGSGSSARMTRELHNTAGTDWQHRVSDEPRGFCAEEPTSKMDGARRAKSLGLQEHEHELEHGRRSTRKESCAQSRRTKELRDVHEKRELEGIEVASASCRTHACAVVD
jgi:hypothetical protein